MSKTALLKLASVKPPVNRFYAYLLTRWRWYSTFVMYFILFVMSASILIFLTGRSYHTLLFYVTESFTLAAICTLFQMAYFRKRWREESPLTLTDTALLMDYGRHLVRKYGKKMTWAQMCEFAGTPEPFENAYGNVIPAPRFDREYPMDCILGGIIAAVIKEGGWRCVPKEAITAIYYYPSIYKSFSLNY